MKLLKTDGTQGYFVNESGEFKPVDKITKEDLLRLVNHTLEGPVELDEYSDDTVKNEAHRIIYKNVFEKLRGLQERREEFIDQSARLFLSDYEKYRDES